MKSISLMQLSNYTYARNWLISLAFFNRYLHQKTQFDDYLTDTAISQFSQDPLPLQLRRSLTKEELKMTTPIPATN